MSLPFSDEDLLEPVSNLIETRIAPILRNDKGDITLLAIKDGKVYVQLQGACVGCSASGNTLKFVVEKELKSFIHPEIEIVNVPHGQEESIKGL
jgi:Fe-S cluster biogenesis protein NfuA